MNKEQLIAELLCLPSTAIAYHTGKHLTELFPDKAMIEVPFCEVEGYASAGQCVIKELFISSKMKWIAHPQQGAMEEVIAGQVTMLREQMVSAHALLAEAAPEDQSMPPSFPTAMRHGFMWRGR